MEQPFLKKSVPLAGTLAAAILLVLLAFGAPRADAATSARASAKWRTDEGGSEGGSDTRPPSPRRLIALAPSGLVALVVAIGAHGRRASAAALSAAGRAATVDRARDDAASAARPGRARRPLRLAGSVAVEPTRTQHRAFGDVAAVWSVLERLGLAGVVDDVVGPRRGDAAASVGTYMALAVTNRVVAPCSKLAFADWWATTAGLTSTPLRSKVSASQVA